LTARNSGLIGTWDTLSLALCLDYAPFAVKGVPSAGVPAELALAETDTPGRLGLDPWPFRTASLVVHCEGQRLDRTFTDDAAMNDALKRAPWETLNFELVPSPPSEDR
jgi:hypothetical protein